MLRKTIWAIAGCLVVGSVSVLALRPDLFHLVFQWLLDRPFVPVAAALALWAIIALLGEKSLQKATRIELVAIIVLFHQEFGSLAWSIIDSLVAFWRNL